MTRLHEQLRQALAGTYDIERELGGGGMSRVFVATERALGRRVVVKVLREDLAGSVNSDRFQREILLSAALQQANIVPVLAAGIADGTPYFAMPFVEGESLRARLANHQGLPLVDCVSIARDVARALSYAHAQGVVHRDIKPDNILLSHGAAVVTDFGIAKAVADSQLAPRASALTSAGTALGTPAYMAPEQIGGDPNLGPATDVYAWGCVVYEMLTGSPPFAGDSPHVVLVAHLTEEPPRAAARRADVPLALDTLVQQCLAKDAKDRPESAGALMLALEGMITASGDTAAAASAATVIVSRMRRSRRKWYVGGGLVLAASVALTLWWMSGAGPRAGGGERASVAVLPFTDLSADGKSSYFGDGLSETLVSTLTAMPSVDVVAPSSSFALRNTPDVREIGRELDVDAVVEGSVQRNGDRVRITAQVVRTQDGRLLWSQNFDRAAADVFVVQDEVADAVARALGIAVPGAGGARSSGGTRSAEAYDLYLQGRALVARRGTADVARAITLLRQALALDSAFAAGWAGLGDAYIAQALYSDVPTVETLRLARASVERALTIAPQLGEALATRAYLRFLQDWDVASADAQFRQAITAAPSHAMAYKWHADVLVAANRPAEALAALETARRLDPRSAIVLANLAGYYRWRGDSAAQAQWTERALAIDPYLPLILRRTTIDAFDRGDSAAFFEAMTRLESVSSRTGAPVPELRDAWRSGGKREVARAQVAAFEARGLPFERARWRMRTGDLAGAFRDLEVAFMERAVWAPFAAGYFADKDMRADPRFTALLNKYGLPLNASQ